MGEQQTKVQVSELNVLDLVMTTKEASEKYDVADCTFRTWIKDGLFQQKDIKKSGNTWLIKREAIEDVLKNKNMFGKTFVVDGDKIHVSHLGYKTKNLQVWYENDEVKEIIENMPQKELIPQMFEVFKEETKMNYKIVVIDNDRNNSDNWFFRKEKVWALTLKGVMETVLQSMKLKEFDTTELDSYLKKVSISI
jgi:Helix-turn-helix domain